MRQGWRRLITLAAIAGVGALAAISISTSLALFSATSGPQHANTFAAGTVSLESCGGVALTCVPSGGATTVACSLKIGQPCRYTLEYTGSLDAWTGLYFVPSNVVACSCITTYTYTTTVVVKGKTKILPVTVVLSPTLSPGQPGATPDLLGQAAPSKPGATFSFTITRIAGTQPCSVMLEGQAVQVDNNSVTEPTYHSEFPNDYVSPLNPLGLSSGPGAWS